MTEAFKESVILLQTKDFSVLVEVSKLQLISIF